MSETFIIAEIGVNHDGELHKALDLIDVASEAGANAVKFQTFNSESLSTKYAKKASYQRIKSKKSESQLDMLRKLELSRGDYQAIKKKCLERNIQFMSTAFDSESLKFLVEIMKVKTLKVPSGEITNGPFLLEHARTGLNIILSSGMSNLKEVETALAYICFGYLNPKKEVKPQEVYKSYHSKEGKSILEEKVIILHCTSQYPAPLEDINLNALRTLKREFGTRIGYSDHSLGYLVSSSAISLGADVIEKHITLDKNLPGPDHGASLDPDEFKEFVKVIKDTEVFLGDGIKRITTSEEETKDVARKSIVANQFIKKGEIFTDENLTIKRPGIGMSPMQVWDLFGKESPKDFSKDEIIEI